MISVLYSREFVRQYKKLEPYIQEAVIERIELFKDPANHVQLRVHKLKGYLDGFYSLSVDYHHRIIFLYALGDKKTVTLLTIGDHTIYN